MNDKFKNIINDLDQANDQRRKWLYASSVFFVGVIFYIAFWGWIHDLHKPWIEWSFISIGLVVSVNWWYWTMSLVRKYIGHQKTVIEVLSDIVRDVKFVKAEVKHLNKPVDKKK